MSDEPLVTVMPRGAHYKAWPKHETGGRCYVVPLGSALDDQHAGDAHMAAYITPNERRLDHGALGRLEFVEIATVIFDFDTPKHATPTPEWRADLRSRVVELDKAHPGLFFYETRGGARVVYRHHATEVLHDREDAQRWSRQYLVAIAYMQRRFGLVADPACKDWTRLFRLPHATRDEGGKPENLFQWGDPRSIGPLLIRPDDADIELAKTLGKKTMAPRKTYSSTPSGSGMHGLGLLWHALDARGEVERQEHRGGYICLCPNRAQHSKNTDWTDTTLCLPPNSTRGVNEVGVIDCKHGHCDEFTVKDWVRFFTPDELEAARVACGIERKRSA